MHCMECPASRLEIQVVSNSRSNPGAVLRTFVTASRVAQLSGKGLTNGPERPSGVGRWLKWYWLIQSALSSHSYVRDVLNCTADLRCISLLLSSFSCLIWFSRRFLINFLSGCYVLQRTVHRRISTTTFCTLRCPTFLLFKYDMFFTTRNTITCMHVWRNCRINEKHLLLWMQPLF